MESLSKQFPFHLQAKDLGMSDNQEYSFPDLAGLYEPIVKEWVSGFRNAPRGMWSNKPAARR
jgi:hypothetical protein